METATKKNTRQGVHGLINDRMIELLEGGIVPWRATWSPAGVPRSVTSRRPFRGINVLLLASIGYEQNLFLTSKQLEMFNGSIKPGKKPHMIVFWGGEQKSADDSSVKATGKLQYYSVYNVAQCVGLPDELITDALHAIDPIKLCEDMVDNLKNGPVIRHKDSDPFYDPLEDCINMPRLKNYAHAESYYSILFHQLAHSTGHHTRLDRMGLIQMSEYGCCRYTIEELVAEIVTNYLENIAGIPSPFIPDEEYLSNWAEKLKGDRYFIFNACSLAQKAIDFILNIQNVKEGVTQE